MKWLLRSIFKRKECDNLSDQRLCPVCHKQEGGLFRILGSTGRSTDFECDICGQFRVIGSFAIENLQRNASSWSNNERRSLSHALRTGYRHNRAISIDSDLMENFRASTILPSVSIQATNLIRFIGDEISRSGQPVYPLPREIKERLSYDLPDSRDASKAGIIDNLMRTQIRDSAFVLVDLTHDNPGAYWEAGYAEGLGKPVIYICEKTKFNAQQSHFDTNHCTTVPWSVDELESLIEQLIATVRRSLYF